MFSNSIFSYSSVTTVDVNPALRNRDQSEDDLSDDFPKHKKKKKT